MTAHSILVTPFIDELVRLRRGARAELEDEFRQAALRAAAQRFGDTTPIAVELSELGEVVFAQELEAVSTVTDRHREIAVDELARACPELGVEAGEIVRLPITYTDDSSPLDNAEQLAELAPLPLHEAGLWDALNEELNAVVQRYFPPPPPRPGSIAEVLATGGGWLQGLSASAGGVTLTIERTYFDVLTLKPFLCWVDYGLVLRLEQADGPPREFRPRWGGNDDAVEHWAVLPSGDAARPALLAQLEVLAAQLADTGPDLVDYRAACTALITAALGPPADGSLVSWLPSALVPLASYRRQVILDEGRVTFRATGVFAPVLGMSRAHTEGVIRIVAEVEGQEPAETDEPGDVISLGWLSARAVELPAPRTEEERRDIERLVAAFREWLDVHLERHAREVGLATYAQPCFFDGFPGSFSLISLIEKRLELGPPGPPPVPPFDDGVFERAAHLLIPVRDDARAKLLGELAMAPPIVRPEHGAQQQQGFRAAGWEVTAPAPRDDEPAPRNVLGVFAVRDWTLLLADDPHRPFSLPSIELVPPEGGSPVDVLLVDAWNPRSRAVVDGDAFAFRRFVMWLREGILRGGHDANASWDDEVGPIEMPLSQWLLFEQPWLGDRFLVDWRVQSEIVLAGYKIEEMASMYGFTGDYVERLRARDIPQWRRFLREVIDPRFGGP